MRAWCLVLLLYLLPTLAARAAELKIATWNLNWLTNREVGLPADVRPRRQEDFDKLRAYAVELDADVIAFQEVDYVETARRVFPTEAWSIHMSRDRVRQRVGFAVRRGLHYQVNPDITSIALDPMAHLRSGVDITLDLPPGGLPGGRLRLLALHLKQGCQYLSFGRKPGNTCLTLMSQFDFVTEWIVARRDEGVPFVVLGDFNRGFEKNDPFNKKIRGAADLTRATEGYSSPCWGREAFIDHILIGGPAREWVKADTLRVLTYRETDPAWKERLSDHCPVSVKLSLPN